MLWKQRWNDGDFTENFWVDFHGRKKWGQPTGWVTEVFSLQQKNGDSYANFYKFFDELDFSPVYSSLAMEYDEKRTLFGSRHKKGLSQLLWGCFRVRFSGYKPHASATWAFLRDISYEKTGLKRRPFSKTNRFALPKHYIPNLFEWIQEMLIDDEHAWFHIDCPMPTLYQEHGFQHLSWVKQLDGCATLW